MTVTFSLALETSGCEGGLKVAAEAGGIEGLDGGRDDAVEEGVAGRTGGLDGAGDFRDRKGEIDDLCDLELEVPENIAGRVGGT